MKTLKQLLLLCLICLISTATKAETYNGQCGSNANWSLDTETGVLEITGSGDMYSYNWNYIDGKYLTTAPWGTYYQSIKSLTVSSDITSIGSGAFYGCSSLTSVGDLSTCTSIGDQAFENCSALTSVGDLSACTSIGYQAFNNCSSLTSVGDLAACQSIGESAFYYCSALQRLTLGETVPTLGNNCFCEANSILVPENALEEYKAASVWSELAERIVSKDVTTDYDKAVTVEDAGSGIQTAIGAANLANVISLKVTGDINAYDIFVIRNKMPNLHTLDLTDANIVATADNYKYYGSYTTTDNILGDYAFYQQSKLVDVKLPKSITSVGSYALQNCTYLNNIKMYEGIKMIGNSAFQSCSNLKQVIIPEGVTAIYSSAFYYCRALKSVSLPSTLTSIDSYSFQCCNKLSTLNLPSNLERIEYNAFCDCNALTEIALPAALTYIGSQAFYNCSSLRTVKATALDPNTVEMSDDSFSNYSGATLYVPFDEDTGWDATYNAYYWNTKWGQFGAIETWKPSYDYITINGDYDQDKGTIPGEDINADFKEKAGYIVGEDASQNLDDVNLKHDGTNGGSIIADGNLDIEKLNIKISVNGNRWYFFCFPFDVPRAYINCDATNYVFRYYDGAARAENGSGGWKDLDNSETTLYAGKGYIFQCDKSGTLTLPITKPTINSDDKSTTLSTHASSNTQDASWNFVGNPYTSYFDLDEMGFDAPVTVWNGSSYEAVRPGDDDYQFTPYQAFFVQKQTGSDNVGFGKDGRMTKTQANNKASAAKAEMVAKRFVKKSVNGRQLINLEMTGNDFTDKTRVVYNDKKSAEYEVDCDAAKFMNTDAAIQFYTLDSKQVRYSINEGPKADVRLGYYAKDDGAFTIKAARLDTDVYIYDNLTGKSYQMTEDGFTFTSEAGTYNDRFVLKLGDATGIEAVQSAECKMQGDAYGVSGVRVNSNQKGIVIENGKKHLK